MRRPRLAAGWAGLVLAAVATVFAAGCAAAGETAQAPPTAAPHRAVAAGETAAGEEPMDQTVLALLASHPGLAAVLEAAPAFRLQVVLGLLEEPPAEQPGARPRLVQHGFRLDAEYFYPASTVKLFAAVAALEWLAKLREERGWPVDADTPLVFHPLFDDEELEETDLTNLAGETITVRHEIRKLFLVSDNRAFNRLFELVGPGRLGSSLDRAGLTEARIVHRLEESRSRQENLTSPKIDFVTEGERFILPERFSPGRPQRQLPAGIEIGRAYLAGGSRVEKPMDFRHKNRFRLADLQRGLCMAVRPDVDCGGHGFLLSEADQDLLLEAMGQLPRESVNPVYDPADYPDDFVKFLLPGLARVVPRHRLRIYNKVGLAYGFTTENAYVVDTLTDRTFFLAATLYTNSNGILNDDTYDYDTVALPFLADLGEAAARFLWGGR